MPRIEWKVDMGTILTATCLLLTAGGLYARMDQRITNIDENGTKVVKELRVEITRLEISLTGATTEIVQLRRELAEVKQIKDR